MLCLTKYTARGPSSRYRLLQFLPWLDAAGIDVDIRPLHDDGYLDRLFAGARPSPLYLARRVAARLNALGRAKRYDLVFIQKEMFPWLPGFAEWVLDGLGAKLVLDLDDAIYLPYRGRWLLDGKFAGVVSRCTLVLAGNRHLADHARRFSDRVVLFPTVVDGDRFTPRPGKVRGEVPVVGWIGSPGTAPFLRGIAPALVAAHRRTPFTLRAVGAGDLEIDGLSVETRPWSEETEADELRAMDIGITPVPDDEWSRGKCALKLLQYMSTGLATVSSPWGSAGEIVIDGDNGFLAGSDDEWIDRLTRLVENRNECDRMGREARRWIESNYCTTNYGPKLAAMLLDVAEGRVPQ